MKKVFLNVVTAGIALSAITMASLPAMAGEGFTACVSDVCGGTSKSCTDSTQYAVFTFVGIHIRTSTNTD